MPNILVQDLRECGQGRIIRSITSTGPNNSRVRATQTIWVVDCDPFWIDDQNACSQVDDIDWPDCSGIGTYIDGCGADLDPDSNPLVGKPKVLNGCG